MISGATSLSTGFSPLISLPSVQVAASRAVAGLQALPTLWPTSSAASVPHGAPSLPVLPKSVPAAKTPLDRKAEPAAEIAVSTAADGVHVGPDETRVSYDVAFNRIAESTAQVTTEIERMHTLTREQSKSWHKASVVAAGVGMCLVAAAVVVLLLGQLDTGIATTIASLIPNALAGIFFGTSRRLDKRVDDLTKGLTEYREAAALVEIAQLIEDKQLRDGIKAEIVRKMLAKK